MGQNKKKILICIVGGLIQMVATNLAISFDLPSYLSTIGTLFATYFGGLSCGIIVAVFVNLISGLLSTSAIYCILPNVLIALSAVILLKDFSVLKKISSAVLVTTILSFVYGLPTAFLYILTKQEKTGLAYPDAMIEYFNFWGYPQHLSFSISSVLVSFTDILTSVIVIILLNLIKNNVKFPKNIKKNMILFFAFGGAISIFLQNPMEVQAKSAINYIKKVYNSDNGLTGGSVNDIAQTDDGTLWIGTFGGLYRFNGKHFEVMGDLRSVHIRSVNCLLVDAKNQLWIGTNGSGLTVCNDDMFAATITTKDGLSSNTIKNILQVSEYKYYIATNKGLDVVGFDGEKLTVLYKFSGLGFVRKLLKDDNGNIIALNMNGEIILINNDQVIQKKTLVKEKANCISFDMKGKLHVGTDVSSIYTFQIENKKIKD